MRFAAIVILVALSGAATAADQPDEAFTPLAWTADATPGQVAESGAATADPSPVTAAESVAGTVHVVPAKVVEPVAGTVHVVPAKVVEPVAGTVHVVPAKVVEPVAGTVDVNPEKVAEAIAGTLDVIPAKAAESVTATVDVIPAKAVESVTGTVDAFPAKAAKSVGVPADATPMQPTESRTANPKVESAGHSANSAMKTTDKLMAELDSFCQRVDEKLSSVDRYECMRIGLLDGGANSNKSTPLLFKDFGAKNNESPARVLLIGGIHGDEYSSVSIVFKWLAMLEEDLGDRFQWRVIPVLNPDGLLMPPSMSQRTNANGVDLNRNFPTPDWESEAYNYWVKETFKNERRYPGPAPLSEPETAWLVEQIESFQPHAVVAVHAPHGVVDFDGPRVPPRQLGPLELRLLGTYPGSMGRYIGIHKGIPLLTLELESAFGMPAQKEVYDIWYDMLGWLHEKIELPLKLAGESELRAPANNPVSVLRSAADEG